MMHVENNNFEIKITSRKSYFTIVDNLLCLDIKIITINVKKIYFCKRSMYTTAFPAISTTSATKLYAARFDDPDGLALAEPWKGVLTSYSAAKAVKRFLWRSLIDRYPNITPPNDSHGQKFWFLLRLEYLFVVVQ